MTTKVKKETYVLTQEEKAQRDAIKFLKGCLVGYIIESGRKYESTKEPTKYFQEGLDFAKPEEKVICGEIYKFKKRRQWATVCHILHNRLRHKKPHTGSWESDQKHLTDFKEERWANKSIVNAFYYSMAYFGVRIDGLEVQP
jgi:hypothetical protein